MLDVIRSNAQSFWVKVAFGVIILVFVFWGVGSFTDTGYVNVIGTVNEEPITAQKFEEAYREAEYGITRNQRDTALTAAQKTQLGREVFQRLVMETLVAQEAKRAGLGVSPYELRLYVGNIEMFQNDKGQFDPDTYKNVLKARRQSPAEFEADLARRILQDRMVQYVVAGGWTDGVEARNRFNFLRQRRAVDYVYIAADSEQAASAEPDDSAVQKYYDEHRTDYVIPQKADVSYIVVDPAKTVSPDSIGEADARAWYDKNQNSFSEPESVQVSHILVPLDLKADEAQVREAMDKALAIKKEIADGRPFAQAADAYNGPNAAGPGGSVGWVTPGMTVQNFEQAAFAAEKGVVTDPVRSEFGLHLILVTDRKPARIRPYEEVEGEIKKNLAALAGRDGLADLLDGLAEDNILGRDLSEVARARGLTAATTGLLSAAELQEKLGIKPEGASAIMAAGANQPVDIPLEAGETYVVVRVVATAPSSFRALDEVRDDVIAKIRTTDGLQKANSLLSGLLKDGADIPAEWIKAAEPVARGSALAPFAPQPELDRALFTAEKGQWSSTVYTVSDGKGQGALIFRVREVMDPPDSEWTQFEEVMTGLTQRERADGVMQEFLRQLFLKSEVVVRNQDMIDRKNM